MRGAFGTCIDTKGTPGAMTVPDGPAVRFEAGDFSMSFWVKVDGSACRLLGKEDFPRTWWTVNVLADGRVELVLGTGGGEGQSVRMASKAPLAKGGWTHVAFVVDRVGRRVYGYIDGKGDRDMAIPAKLTGSLSVEGKDLRIPSNHKPFTGLFDELRIYRRTLSSAEVKASCDGSSKGRTVAGE